MTHYENVNKMMVEFTAKGINKRLLAPPLYQLFWKMGLRITPPLFASFIENFLILSIPSSLAFGFVTWALNSWVLHETFNVLLKEAMSFGIIFGLFYSVYYKFESRRHKIPSWRVYGEGKLKALESKDKAN